MTVDGVKACSRACGRPARPGQSYCQFCHTEYCRRRRQGMIERLLTPEEWEMVKELRAAADQHGRHEAPEPRPRHARAAQIPDQHRPAAIAVCGHAIDRAEAELLLAMLGLMPG